MDDRKIDWQRLALFLLSCHCGTVEYECSLKSYPKSFKERMVSIARKAQDITNENDGYVPRVRDSQEWVLGRLKDVIESTKEVTP